MANMEIHKSGISTRFSKDYQPKGAGRKPNHLKKYLKQNNIGTQDVRDIISGILASAKTIDDLKKIVADPKTPPIIKIPIYAILKEYSYGKINSWQWLIEYAFGQSKQIIESKSEIIDNVSKIERLERDKIKTELLKNFISENEDEVKKILIETEKEKTIENNKE